MRIFLLICMAILLIMACEQESEPAGEPSQWLVFQSLEAEEDTLSAGETTRIKALATGYKLNYYWSATTGDILGSGAAVTYASSPCGCGKSRITCQIVDGYDQTDTKTIVIVVQ